MFAAKRPKTIRGEPLPNFIEPQLALQRDGAPAGEGWTHEIKLDGYRMHARIDRSDIRLLTRTGLDWTDRYRATAATLGKLTVRQAPWGRFCAAAMAPDWEDGASLPLADRADQ
jgi:bifunctional non-homologous end joining protein LigD